MLHWTKAQEDAFTEIKRELSSEPILAIYNPHAKTELHTDASQVGLSGILYQEQTDGRLHPISYYSRKTTIEESRYHSYELEALAIVNSVERFRVYLIGIHFVIRTDCNSLKMLQNKRDLSPRIGRWFVKLSEYNYTIEYHAGSINTVADALSRYPIEEGKETEIVGLPILHIKVTTDWIAALQRNCLSKKARRQKLLVFPSCT
ncbi:RNase H-like domain found in reverse transcriptase [Popillia japonica]|uniref:RNase H-like domain found in reverse transcriptase n=1 Tax=Popillia japonica TaxID=7064 RepID=A0AAW1ISL9_POPJA